jgi:predicted nuclease of restriction endonuclease-like (RecB) superfamily
LTDLLILNDSYRRFVADIKTRYQAAQLKAARRVNTELIEFYWQLGKAILDKQAQTAWGSKFLEQLAKDLQTAFPGAKGFSVRNLEFIRQFAQAYPDEVTKQTVSQLPWGHIIVLMQKVKDPVARAWYVENTLRNGISRSVLIMQIEQNLYQRQGIDVTKTSNFKARLPQPQSDLAQQMLKNPYSFDFLTIGKRAKEREIEGALVQHISKFLLELGAGFAFMGHQYKLNINGQDYFIDMLFYHVKLRAYVVVELKATAFKPEHTGKLNFYLSAVDDLLKSPHDNPTIGLLLCKSRDQFVAEYALRNVQSPIGVSEYELLRQLPQPLATELPSIEEIEAELGGEEHDSP